MEKQLINKMRNHELDDVDKDMITARLKVAQSEVEDILSEMSSILNRLHSLCKDKKEEMALLEFRFIVAFDDKIMHGDNNDTYDGVPCICTLGARDGLKGLVSTLQKAIDS